MSKYLTTIFNIIQRENIKGEKMQIINLVVSSVLQVILFSLIPFVWWLISGKKQSNFFKWLGFKKPIINDKKKYILGFLLTILLLSIPAFIVIPMFVDTSNMATSQFSGQGSSALIPALIYSIIQTGLSEEIFFRGFLGKRLINKFGYTLGNAIQALLFGLMHGVMFISIAGIVGAIIIIVLTGIVGWLMGWINEKLSEGSIISSWLLHSCANILASVVAMFNLI